MRFGVLGAGRVGRTLGGKLVALGHEVRLGSRAGQGEEAERWVAEAGAGAGQGTFAESAAFGEMLINATAGAYSLDALAAAGSENLSGKVLIDVANPLDTTHGMPPTLTVCNDDSLGERIQREFPHARVVKALNTVNARVMVEPARVGASHTAFLCGNDDEAKAAVRELLVAFGWPERDVMDLGDITAARGMEMYLPLWLRLWGAAGGPDFNVKVVIPA